MTPALFAFNWLPATYAHPDWLGRWEEHLPRSGALEARLVHRVSFEILQRHDLLHRYLHADPSFRWVLGQAPEIRSRAQRLGIAMLGGVVRRRIDRKAVQMLGNLLGEGGREQALVDAERYPSLASPVTPWPLRLRESWASTALGASMMAMLLDSHASGARERFCFRFPRGFIQPLETLPVQRVEAMALLDEMIQCAPAASSTGGQAAAQVELST